MYLHISFLIAFILIPFSYSFAQESSETDEDALFMRKIYDAALTKGQCYPWLEHLSTKIGGRLAGSKGADKAVSYTKSMLDTIGLDDVRLQACMVPKWVRGAKETVQIVDGKSLNCLALGNSVGTDKEGVTAEVIEVQTLDDLETLGKAKLKGKIVFFNRPMDPTHIRTFHAYGGAVDQRVWGASKASKYGALGVLVRSMTTRLDDIPHTGTLVYEEDVENKIAGIAISTNDAEHLSDALEKGPVKVFMQSNCETLPDVESHNVIGEIKGSEFPDEIIIVGGHLDSWDVGQGAHDDGAGCVQSMDVLQLLKRLNYQPKRTIRCVLFMNEENGLAGGKKYAKASNEKKEFHMAAIESDAGGFTPRGFSFDGHESVFQDKYRQVTEWLPLFEAYGLYFKIGGSGADIGPLKDQKGLLVGFRPDSQRYFDYHHTPIDTFEAVNKRELELGTAAITSLVFLLDKYGLK